MRLLILAGEGAMSHIRLGYAHAAAHLNHQCFLWHPKSKKPIHDVFAEFQPDVVLLGSWEIDRAMRKCLLSHTLTRVILWGGNWGDKDNEIDYKNYPILRITEAEKELLPVLIKTNQIENVFVHYSQAEVEVTHNKWRELGLEPVGIPPAADLTIYGQAAPSEEYRCDVSFVGGYWPYKGINFNKWLVPLCNPEENLRVKIFGWGDWPVSQHLGTIDMAAMPSLFASTCVNVNVFEPHVGKYGFDGNERAFKVLACGGFCVSEAGEEDIFTNGEVEFAETPSTFKDMIHHYINHPDTRLPFIERGIKSVKTNHNYFVRLQTVLKALKLEDDNLNEVVRGLQTP